VYRALVAARSVRLFLLQARTGKRTPLAALRIAHDLAEHGLITRREALDRLGRVNLDVIQNFRLKPVSGQMPFARGTSASTGVAIGAAVFDPQRVAQVRQGGKAVILIRENAETSDISALSEAVALVAAVGARTSHAAVVARELGKGCVVGSGFHPSAARRSRRWRARSTKEGGFLGIGGVAVSTAENATPPAGLDHVSPLWPGPSRTCRARFPSTRLGASYAGQGTLCLILSAFYAVLLGDVGGMIQQK
jgi:phosphohistidine swiveling domain-containing protein